MIEEIIWILVGVYIFLTLILTPVQYRYISALKEEKSKQNYEDKSFGEQYLHYNAQANILFIGANILATIIWHIKHRKDKGGKS